MRAPGLWPFLLALVALAAFAAAAHAAPAAEFAARGKAARRLVFVAGPPSHEYGGHEHYAGCVLIARLLSENVPGLHTVVYRGWPDDADAFAGASAIVIDCDGGGGHVAMAHLDQLDALMKRGVGLACLHYAVVLPKGRPGDLLKSWIGGYFETGWSVNPFWEADFRALPDHPVTRGVRPFRINDEWYYHMRFADGMKGVVPLLTAVPPDATRQRPDSPYGGNPHVRARLGMPEHVAWAYERPGGGRGFGFTGLHWHWSWAHDDFRRLVLNALVWIAGADVPPGGVPSKTPTLDELEADIQSPKPANWSRERVQRLIEAFNRPRAAAASAEAPPQTAKETAVSATGLPTAVRGQDERIRIETDRLAAEITPNGYVTGVAADTFVDKQTGARDGSFGLDIVDFLMGPGAEGGAPYEFGNLYHGNIAKHYIEEPQICTQAKHIDSELLVGRDFVAVRQWWQYTKAAPGYVPGSRWEQTLVFPMGRRYFLSSDCITSANDVENVFLRLDMPGHAKHQRGDAFEEVYLSYEGRIPAADFFEDFPPDARHLYQRGRGAMPGRMIRARKIRGEGKPWLAGITLDPKIVSEAWCHQRGYVCFIEEIGGLPVKRGDCFAAAYAVGYFDSVPQMQAEADRLRGFTSLAATKDYWLLAEGVLVRDGPDRFRIVPQGRWPAPTAWRLLVHGRGEATVNGQTIRIDGERTVEVPASK